MIEDLYPKILASYGSSLRAVFDFRNYPLQIGPSPSEIKVYTENAYLCPLCIKNLIWIDEGAICWNHNFTVDHFPPKSVGGKKTVLVCEHCNSISGAKIENSLNQYLQFQSFLEKKDKSVYPTSVTYEGIKGHYNITMGWENNKLVYTVPYKKYPLVKKWVFNPSLSMSFKKKILSPSASHINRALLKAAYLYCFSLLGFDFVLSETAHRLRLCISGKGSHPLGNLGVFGEVEDNDLEGLYAVTSPEEQRSLLVFLNISLKSPGHKMKAFVLIPYAGENNWERLEHFKSWMTGGQSTMKLQDLNYNFVKAGDYFRYSQWSGYNVPSINAD